MDNAVIRFLRPLDLSQALAYVGRCSRLIWIEPDSKQYQHEEVIGGILRRSERYHISQLAYLASEIIINARGSEPFGIDQFNKLIVLNNSESDGVGRVKSAFEAIRLLLSTAFPQIAVPTPPRLINRFGRYWLLFSGIPTYPSTGIKILSTVPSIYSPLSLEEFILGGTVVLALAMWDEHGFLDIQRLVDIRLGDVNLTVQAVENFIKRISVKYDQFGNKLKFPKDKPLLQHTLLNPLLRYPIIEVGDKYYVPIVQLLIERVGQGIFEDYLEILKEKSRETFLHKWGFTFEKYIQYLIDQSIPSLKVWAEQTYQEQDEIKSCDLIIQEGTDILLIECKTTPMDKLTKTLMNAKNYEQELEKIVKGVNTILRTVKDIKAGKLVIPGLSVDDIQNWVGCVVTLDEYMLYPRRGRILEQGGTNQLVIDTSPIRNHFLELCRTRFTKKARYESGETFENFQPNNIHVVSVDDFERLLATAQLENRRLLEFFISPIVEIKDAVHPLLQQKFQEYIGSVSRIE